MLIVPTPPMLPYYLGAFSNRRHQFSRLLRKTAITELTVISFACFIRAAYFKLYDLCFPSRFRALQDEGRLCGNEGVLIPLSHEMKANVLDRGLLNTINDCEVYPVAALMAFA